MGLDIVDHICRRDIPSCHDVPRNIQGFHGRCIGDSAAAIRGDVLRLIAFQVAGMINDVKGWVEDAISQLQRAGAHVGVFTETRIQSADRHHLIVNAFKSKGYLAISHNAITQRSTICTSHWIRSLALALLESFWSCLPATYQVGPTSFWTRTAEQSRRALMRKMDLQYVSSAFMEYRVPAVLTSYPSLQNPRRSFSSTNSCYHNSNIASRMAFIWWLQVT